MSIFNIISKVFNIPLLSVATSFVAEDIARNGNKGSNSGETTIDAEQLLMNFRACHIKILTLVKE
jgi:hypothetical protein